MGPGIKFKTVDEYFSTLSQDAKGILEQMRHTIKQAAPQATEVISYNMPAIKIHGILVYYAAHTGHIGFLSHIHPQLKYLKMKLFGIQMLKGHTYNSHW